MIQGARETRRLLLLFALLAAPGFLNGFLHVSYPVIEGWPPYAVWVGADYISRFWVIAFLIFSPTLRLRSRERLGKPTYPFEVFEITLLAFLLALVSYLTIDRTFDLLFPETILFRAPRVTDSLFFWLDMTVGLLLVAVTEELVWRRLFYVMFLPRLKTLWLAVPLQAALFGLMHWEHGAGGIAGAAAVGVIFTWATFRSGSLIPAIIAHYFINFILFSM